MKRFVRLLTAAVRRAPWVVVIVSVVVTAALGAAGGMAGRVDGNEAFAPEAEEITAFEDISELFGESADESSVQVIVTSEDGDVIGPDGLAAVAAVRRAVLGTTIGDQLSLQPGRPDFISFMLPVQRAIEQGRISADADEAGLKTAFRAALDEFPAEDRAFAEGLVSAGSDLEAPSAQRGLVLFFFQTGDLEDGEITDALAEMAEAVQAATPDGTRLDVFSFGLLFADEDEFQRETQTLFMFAGLIIVLILLFVFWVQPRGRLSVLGSLRRAAADMALTIATIFMSISWMMGIGALLGPSGLGLIADPGPMTDIVPILIIGLGVDYSIHLSSRYKEEVGAGVEVSRSIGRAIRTVGIALALATITTAVGFLTNVFNPVPALVVFGVYASIGIGAAFLLMLTFVAAVRLLLDRRAERAGRLPAEALGANRERILPTLIGKVAVFAERIPALTVAAALVLGGAGVYGATQLETVFRVTDFVPDDNVALEALGTLQEDFGGGLGETSFVVVRGDVATPEAHNAMVTAFANLADTPDVIPLDGTAAAESPVSLVASLADPDSAIHDPGFAAAAAAAGLQPDGTVTSGADVVAIYDAALAVGPMDSFAHRTPSGGYDAALFRISTQAGEDRADVLRANLDEDFAPVTGAGLVAVPTSDNIIPQVVGDALEASQVSSLAFTLLAAMLLLVVNFWFESRRPFLGVITIFPVVLVVLWVFGLMAATGIPFGPVTATIAAIAIGIGVPYTIHVTHRYQEDRLRFDTPEEAIASTTTNTGGALAGSAFTTAAGFGVLMTSSTVPFQQFGRVSVYAITLALVAAVLVLPSMLILWDRWHRRRGEDAVDRDTVLETFAGDDDESPVETAAVARSEQMGVEGSPAD